MSKSDMMTWYAAHSRHTVTQKPSNPTPSLSLIVHTDANYGRPWTLDPKPWPWTLTFYRDCGGKQAPGAESDASPHAKLDNSKADIPSFNLEV